MTRVLYLTDIHDATSYLSGLVDQVRDVDLAIVGGDLTNFGGAEAAQRVLAPLREAYPSVLCVHGNVDQPSVSKWLLEEGLSVHGRAQTVENLVVYGCGGANPTPFGTPTELEEDQIGKVLRSGHASVPEGARHHVVVAHMPPYQTGADRIFTKKHVGSSALREFLTETSPKLCLTGHIHESACIDRLGTTVVVNPGPFSSGYFATIDVGDERVQVQLRRVEASTMRRVIVYSGVVLAKVGGFVTNRG